MKKSIIVLVVVAMTLVASFAQAEDGKFHDSRIRLLMFGKQPIAEQLELRTDFIPAPNLLGDLAPMAYVGVGYTPSENLDLAASAGWAFAPDEPIASVRVSPSVGSFYAWSDLEVNLPSKDVYYFAQVEYKAVDALHFGLETEGWGNVDKGGWSHGAGPNVLLRFGKQFGVDLALHGRELDSHFKPEFVTRVLLFL